MLAELDGSVLSLAQILGATESSIRLLLSLVAGIPLAFLHRAIFYGRNTSLQNLYFTLCGLAIAYFNFGFDAVHSFANIVIIYLLLVVGGGTKASVVAAFIFNTGYLLYGYYLFTSYRDGKTYSITWCTPHCVLCLRLIGLVYDRYDGARKKEELSVAEKESALTKTPSLLEICGFSYFFGGFLTGPQFSMRRYLKFINGEFSKPGEKTDSVLVGLTRAILGGVLISVYQVTEMWIPVDYLITDEYAMQPLWWKLGYIMVWGKFHLYKYVGVWLIAEGSCILTGLTYNGIDESTGRTRWNGCANVRITRMETAQTFANAIESFNVNTNAWMAKYVYKRLKFLGNKYISQSATLFYLAIWHGIHPGYFNNFMLEFFIMKFELDMKTIVSRLPRLARFCQKSVVKPFTYILKKMFLHTFLAYPLASFVLLTTDRCFKFYSSIHFIGHILFMGWPLVSLVVFLLLPRKVHSNGVTNGNVVKENGAGTSKKEN